MRSLRVQALLALVAWPLALFLAWCAATIWASTAPPGEAGAPGDLNALSAWLLAHLPLMRDGEPMWGWRELFFLAPMLALPAAFGISREPFPTRTGRVAATRPHANVRAATVLVAGAYNAVGWPFDLLAILVATVAATVAGISALRQGSPLERSQAAALASTLALMPLLALVGMGYPSPSVFLGLLATVAAVAVLRARRGRAARTRAPLR